MRSSCFLLESACSSTAMVGVIKCTSLKRKDKKIFIFPVNHLPGERLQQKVNVLATVKKSRDHKLKGAVPHAGVDHPVQEVPLLQSGEEKDGTLDLIDGSHLAMILLVGRRPRTCTSKTNKGISSFN